MYCATLPPDDDFTVFEEENEKHKNGFFSCPPGDLHPKRSLQPDFRDRGVSNRVTNAGQFFVCSWRGELVPCRQKEYHLDLHEHDTQQLDRESPAAMRA